MHGISALDRPGNNSDFLGDRTIANNSSTHRLSGRYMYMHVFLQLPHLCFHILRRRAQGSLSISLVEGGSGL